MKFVCRRQKSEEDESCQLHPDGSEWDAAEDARRKRSAFKPDQLLRVASQGTRGQRPTQRRINSHHLIRSYQLLPIQINCTGKCIIIITELNRAFYSSAI